MVASPSAVGFPRITPLVIRESPAGSAPLASDQVTGPLPPLTSRNAL
jgi:hypothetical protein